MLKSATASGYTARHVSRFNMRTFRRRHPMLSSLTAPLRRRRRRWLVMVACAALCTLLLCLVFGLGPAAPAPRWGPGPSPEHIFQAGVDSAAWDALYSRLSEGQRDQLRSMNRAADDAMQKPVISMAYGTTARPPFRDLARVIDDLPVDLIPQWPYRPSPRTSTSGASAPEARRLVIVGDVHGMREPLEALLDKLGFDRSAGDHLILTGDLVNKGPDSPGVIDLAIRLGASAVRGNHDDRVLLAAANMKSRDQASAPATTAGRSPAEDDNSVPNAQDEGGILSSVFNRIGGAYERRGLNWRSWGSSKGEGDENLLARDEIAAMPHGDAGDRATAASLSPSQLAWLADLPVILRVSPIPHSDLRGGIAVVHAGLVPGVPLSRQDPSAVMNTRALFYPAGDLRRDAIRDALAEAAQERIAEGRSGGGGDTQPTDEQIKAEYARTRAAGQHHSPSDVVAIPVSRHNGDESWVDAWERWQKEHLHKPHGDDGSGGSEDDGSNKGRKGGGGGGGSDGEAAKWRQYPSTIIFGHDAKRGLQLGEHTFGLDTGCVYGRQLSALVIEPGAAGIEHRIEQIQCTAPQNAKPPLKPEDKDEEE